jgi:hypothetical protein
MAPWQGKWQGFRTFIGYYTNCYMGSDALDNADSLQPPDGKKENVQDNSDAQRDLPEDDADTPHQNSNEPVMEVHDQLIARDAGFSKRNWKSYFWEFLMLFLAVVCGFFAEYQLEHKIEREREKRYIISMMKDLNMDTVNFSIFIRDGQETMGMIDSIITLLKTPNPNIHAPQMYLMARRITHTISNYEIVDRAYSALRTSGNLRLFSDQDVAENVTAYYSDISTLKTQQNYLFNLLLQYEKDVNEVFDPTVFHDMYKAAARSIYDTTDASTFRYLLREPKGKVSIRTDPQAIRNLSSTLHYLYARIISTNSNVRNQRVGAVQLMDFLVDKYNLRKE